MLFAIFKPVLPHLGWVTVRQGGGPPGRGEAAKDHHEDQLDDGEDDGEARMWAQSVLSEMKSWLQRRQ